MQTNNKLREALELFAHMNDDGHYDEALVVLEIVAKARAALSTPPRNCERFATEADAQIAFLREGWRLIGVRDLNLDPFDGWTDEMKSAYSKWLFSTAAEQKGDTDGR